MNRRPPGSFDRAPGRPAGPRPALALVTARDADGVLRLIGRRPGAMRGHVVVCPDGHRAARIALTGGDVLAVECVHRQSAGGASRESTAVAEDVHWLAILPTFDGGRVVVECTAEEARHMERRQMDGAEAAAYLGAVGALRKAA